MSDQFYEPAPGDLVACDDGLHFILLEVANAHCNWVMRRHPDGGLVSVRKATEHELAHAKARQHLRAGVAQLEVSEGQLPERQGTKAGKPDLVAYHCVDQYGQKKVLLPGAEGIKRHILHGSVLKQLTYMATACRLLDERDEALTREAELKQRGHHLDQRLREEQAYVSELAAGNTALLQRLAEAKRLLVDVRGQLCGPDQRAIDAFLASPGCADGEQPS